MAHQKLTPIIATGATAPRYLGDRFSDIVNVKDFGAVGDGSTDDTAAFSAAAAASSFVFVPGGTYSLSADVSGGFYSFDDVTITGTGGAVNGKTKIFSFTRGVSLIGSVFWFAGTSAPQGSLLCDGAAVSRTTYANLFAVIGTTYGAGDGSTTFALPNLMSRFIEGGVAGVYYSSGLPNITGSIWDLAIKQDASNWPSNAGAFFQVAASENSYTGHNASAGKKISAINFKASESNNIYGSSNIVQPPALTLLPCIVY